MASGTAELPRGDSAFLYNDICNGAAMHEVSPDKVQGCRPLREDRSQQREHAPTGREFDKRLTALWQSLVIASQPTKAG